MTTAPATIRRTVPEYAVDADGIVQFDVGGAAGLPGFSMEVLHRLDSLLDEVDDRVRDGTAKALILRCGAGRAAAIDIAVDEVRDLPDAEAARAWAREGQRVIGRIERLPVPTVAALSGHCLGGSLQVALACSYRLAVGDPATRLGFAEIRLGVPPAWGGTVRLPRLIGVRAALDLLLRRSTVSARRAEAIGLVDDVFAPARFEPRLLRFVHDRIRHGRGEPFSRRGLVARVFEDTAPGRRVLFSRVARSARRQARVPGPIADPIVRTVLDGVTLPLDTAFQREAEAFAALLNSPMSRGLLHDHRLRSVRSPTVPGILVARGIRRAAVVGAGSHGTLLARLLLGRGVTVRLKDLRRDAATRAVERVRAHLASDADRGSIEQREAERRARRVSGTTGYGGFGRVDVVIETVGVRPDTKAAVLREVEQHVRESCILLTTSPLITATELQRGMMRPGQVAGLHLFMPGGSGRLAEVAQGAETSAATVATACALARRLGRSPVVVTASPGLVAYRLVVLFLNEALRLRAEGIPRREIDAAVLRFGMPVGPFRLLAQIGEPEHRRLAGALAALLGDRFLPPPVTAPPTARRAPRLARMVSGALRRLPQLATSRGGRVERLATTADQALTRLLLGMTNEAARLIEERVVPTALEVDRIVTLAIGFPPERGGLLFHADTLGASMLIETLDSLAASHGPRFEPAPLLLSMLEQDTGFHAPDTGARVRIAAAAGQPPPEVLT